MHYSAHQIIKLNKQLFVNDKETFNNLIELTKPYYEDPKHLIEREFNRCDTLYLIESDDKTIAGCLMAAWEPLTNEYASAYLGLGMIRQNVNNNGLLKSLFNHFIKDAQNWILNNQQPLILWATTASPFAYLAITSVFENVEPRIDGSYSNNGKNIATLIRTKMGWASVQSLQHPFVIYRATQDTHYSLAERERINEALNEKNFTLFSKLNINESNGDRLLTVFQIPINENFRTT